MIYLFLEVCFTFRAECTENVLELNVLEKQKFKTCTWSWCLAWSDSLVFRGMQSLMTYRCRELFSKGIRFPNNPRSNAEVESTNQESSSVSEIYTFHLYHHNFGKGLNASLDIHVWYAKPQSSCLILKKPSDLLCRFLAIISVLYAKETLLLIWKHFELILCLIPSRTHTICS